MERTWIEINLDALVANYRTACALTSATVTCVLKSNAYGHGAVRIAQALQEAGCASFAVSCAREALELRHQGIEGEILIMGRTEKDWLPRAVQAEVTFTVATVEDISDLEKAAATLGKSVSAHIKLDTGFHRLGFPCTQQAAAEIAALAKQLHHVRLAGLFSHLGLIHEQRDQMQYNALIAMKQFLSQYGICPQDVHLCDSIGLVRYPQWHMSRVRVGAMLYGVRPAHSEQMNFQNLETLIFRTRVAQVLSVPAGEPVGYSDDVVLLRPSKIATLCAGYGDGYPRSLSNRNGEVVIRGRRAPVVGLVCMDQMMVDVTDIPDCAVGDTADLLGGGISYGEYADRAHTNRNECLTILSRRPVRLYKQAGKVVTRLDELLSERSDLL